MAIERTPHRMIYVRHEEAMSSVPLSLVLGSGICMTLRQAEVSGPHFRPLWDGFSTRSAQADSVLSCCCFFFFFMLYEENFYGLPYTIQMSHYVQPLVLNHWSFHFRYFFSLAPGSLLLWDGLQGPQVGFLGRSLYPYKQMCRESKCDLITCGVVNMSPKIHRVKSNHTGGAIRRWYFGDG